MTRWADCPICKKDHVGGFTGMSTEQAIPDIGDLCVCDECAGVYVFLGGMNARIATAEDIGKHATLIREAQKLVWDRLSRHKSREWLRARALEIRKQFGYGEDYEDN